MSEGGSWGEGSGVMFTEQDLTKEYQKQTIAVYTKPIENLLIKHFVQLQNSLFM